MKDLSFLPVYRQRKQVLKALEKHQVIIVESPTGSGKTTQLPMIFLEAGLANVGMIGLTQPRRIATLGIFSFLQDQLGEERDLVGYKMRFTEQLSSKNKIKVMTDGTLLQELHSDPYLSQYSLIMVDEAHERSLNIDFILGFLKSLLPQRPDLKVVISSATLNTALFHDFFPGSTLISIKTHTYPVSLLYDPLEDPSSQSELCEKIYSIIKGELQRSGGHGDFLVFLPGEAVIKAVYALLTGADIAPLLHVLPLYARLANEEQQAIFLPPPEGRRKVVLSTNIAETSLTIDGITTVIDSGLVKLSFYSHYTYSSALVQTSVSRASADQRKGRAGRTQKGVCYRLYTESEYKGRPEHTMEEIFRSDLSEVILRMISLGIHDPLQFDFISTPPRASLEGALRLLTNLGVINTHNELTKVGSQVTAYPLSPVHAKIVVNALSHAPTLLEEVLICCSYLTSSSPFLLVAGEEDLSRAAMLSWKSALGDFDLYVRLFRAFEKSNGKEAFCKRNYLDLRTMVEILNVKEQLERISYSLGGIAQPGGKMKELAAVMAVGLRESVAVYDPKTRYYSSLTSDEILIHPGSSLYKDRPRYIVAGEVVKTSKTFARSVSLLSYDQVQRVCPELLALTTPADSTRRRKTQDITIGASTFSAKKRGNGQSPEVVVPYSALREALATTAPNLPVSASLSSARAVIFYRGRRLFARSPLYEVITLLRHYSLSTLEKTPKSLSFQHYELRNARSARTFVSLLEALPAFIDEGGRRRRGDQLFIGAVSRAGRLQLSRFLSPSVALSSTIETTKSLLDSEMLRGKDRSFLGALRVRFESLVREMRGESLL